MRMTMRIVGALAAVAMAGCLHRPAEGSRHAATVEAGRAIVKEVMADTGAASVSVALVDERGVIWSEAFGQSDTSTGRGATPSTLYGACSVSKLLATVAVMILVDQGKVALDEPAVTYLKAFSMPLDARYRDITVRMLLNHSSGLPTHDRHSVTVSPLPAYGAEVMEGMKLQRLVHAPGLISCYNNEGFTMVENLVATVSGQGYPAFVRRHILEPLGMDRSQFMDVPLPAAGYARPGEAGAQKQMYAFNMYASGGLFATAEDLSRLARMLLGKGVLGSRRILSEASVAAMAQDQRLGSFNPVPNESMRFGLGWDTMASPGFAQLDLRAWQKTGDFPGYYWTNIAVLPDEGLAVVVVGACGSGSFGSTHAVKISERILLRALVERGRLDGMPRDVSRADLPVQAVPAGDKADFTGPYASSNGICRVAYAGDDSLALDIFNDGWTRVYQDFKLRSDGWYAADGDPVFAMRLLRRNGSSWLAQRQGGASGHYTMGAVMAQSLADRPAISGDWQGRLAERWVPVDKDLYVAYPVAAGDPSFRFAALPGMPGYLSGRKILREASAQRLDGFFLTAPDAVRGLQDAAVEVRSGQDWLRLGCNLYRPVSGLPSLGLGTATLAIGGEGLAEWRSLPAGGRMAVSGATWWFLYDADFQELASGPGDGGATFSGEGAKLLVVFGPAGTTIRVEVT